MKPILICLVTLMLTSCVSMQEQCDNDVSYGRFGTFQDCMAYRSRAMEEASNSLTGLSNQLNQMNRSPQPASFAPVKTVDFNCLNSCTAAGYGYGLCESKCSY